MMTSTADIQRLFVDSSAWIDLMNKNERHHGVAVAFHKSLAPMTLRITTWGIVSKTFTWIRYHIGNHDASRWLALKEALEHQGFLQVVFPDPQMELGVRKVLDRFHDQALSYVDAFSIALIQSRPDIDAIFAFDHHMTLAGLPVLPTRSPRQSSQTGESIILRSRANSVEIQEHLRFISAPCTITPSIGTHPRNML